jgi:hypothetical protein
MNTNPDEMLKEIFEIMRANVQAFENGDNDVDMLAFDGKVRGFCNILTGLPPYEAKKYEPELKVIIDNLNSFIPKIEARRNSLEDQINALNQRNIGYNAYGNALMLAMQNLQSED